MFPMLEMLTGEKPQICSRISSEEYADLLGNIQGMCNFNYGEILTDVTAAEFALMYHAAIKNKTDNKMLTVAQAAAILHVTVPAISRTLKNLENKEYLSRITNQNDRRSVYISITAKGMEVLVNNLRCFEDTMKRILSNFSDEELHTMIRLQTKFVKAARNVSLQA